jgi:hypothetical protein
MTGGFGEVMQPVREAVRTKARKATGRLAGIGREMG